MKHNIMVARIVGNGFHHAAVGNWLVDVVQACLDPAIGLSSMIAKCFHVPIQRQPVAVARNLAVKTAKERNVSFLFMVDDDMGPPAGWFEFVLRTMGSDHAVGMTPCVIGAPACAGAQRDSRPGTPPAKQGLPSQRQPPGSYQKRRPAVGRHLSGAGLVPASNARLRTTLRPPCQMRVRVAMKNIVFGEVMSAHYIQGGPASLSTAPGSFGLGT